MSPSRGAAGTSATFTAPGPPIAGGTTEIRWDSISGPQLGTIAGSGTSATPITIPEAQPGIHYVMVVNRSAAGEINGTAAAPFELLRAASLKFEPAVGSPGSTILVKGSGFASGRAVTLHWGPAGGTMLATTTGPSFSKRVTVPASTPGEHRISAVSTEQDGSSYNTTSDFKVVPAPPRTTPAQGTNTTVPTSTPGLDTVGPAMVGATLARANRSRLVSQRGYVTLFCGRFTEAGVTGTCGAKSVTGSRLLRLRDREFEATPGRAVRVRFRLAARQLSLLRRRGRVPMRGLVKARDGLWNYSRAPFRFTLRAPQKAGGAEPASSGTAAGW